MLTLTIYFNVVEIREVVYLTENNINKTILRIGIPEPGAVIVRAEEALIVILVLLLWAAAIALFFNRWGKIRMLEPYQPKFQQQHRQSCTTIEQNPLQNRHTFSKCNILCGDCPTGNELSYQASGQTRPRQNSVFIGSSASLLPGSQGTPRRTKSAFDLQFLILSESNAAPDSSTGEQEAGSRSCKPANESTRLLLRERKASVCQSDRIETTKPPIRDRRMSICQFDCSPRTWQRDRGMSVCQFDRMDVIARPLQRDRGGSICQFDRTDVLARPLQRDRVGSAYHFDRMDVLARPNLSYGKCLTRERRVSTCSFLEKDEEATNDTRMERRLSSSNAKIGDACAEEAECEGRMQEIFAKCRPRQSNNSIGHYTDQPSCSKTPDVVFGYKATCV
ncbi:hypothetical protein E2986_12319 [Frieseomelitta varia]|uniref:Fibronectin type III domain-containing protein n=1 Tax=Frieseomelitta varia TaxID=561572 RepID=A0A833R8A9_9HYME|nr:hypothetical protein E2986_12319 [Frieseomelitta varia]